MLDFLANIPFLIYFIVNGIPSDPKQIDEKKDDWIFNVVSALKIFRLAHANKITDVVSRFTFNLSEVFWRKKYTFENL